jgi:hypothetical protein
MSVFSPSGSASGGGSLSVEGVATPTIINLEMTLADTEYNVIIPEEAKRFYLRTRQGCLLRVAYASGETASNYVTIQYGAGYSEEGLSLTGALTLYLRGNKAAVVIEIVYWQ